MKILKSLFSAALILTLTSNAAALNSFAYTFDADIQAEEVYTGSGSTFESPEAAADYMREKIKSREKTVDLYIPLNYDFEEAIYTVMKKTFAETSDGAEGDYIRTSLKSYSCSGGYSSGYMKISFTMTYLSDAEQEKYVEKRVDEILDSLKLDSKDDYGKITAIYEYIINNVDYDYTSSDDSRYTAYGALYNGEAVCQGFAHLFYRMTKEAGLSSRMITGDAGGAHAWNIAAVDGTYYLLDSTWDTYYTNISQCSYFMKGTEDFDENDKTTPHIPESSDEAESPYNVDYTSAEFKLMYPISAVKYDPLNSEPQYNPADVNGDSFIDSSDASLILVAYSRLSTGYSSSLSKAQEIAADINKDGIINSSDASDVLSYYAYTSTGGSLPIEDFLEN